MITARKYFRYHEERLSLERATTHLLEECRMVLPGILALFGFQLIAVLSEGFDRKLDQTGQSLHVVALLLVVLSAGLIMAPAAFHRIASPRSVSKPLLTLFSNFLLWGMLPLALGMCLDVYLISSVVLPLPWAIAGALFLFSALVVMWFGLPQRMRSLREEDH